MIGSEALLNARERVIRAALAVVLAERSLNGEGSAPAVVKADGELYLAAQDMTRAVNDIPEWERPRGWRP